MAFTIAMLYAAAVSAGPGGVRRAPMVQPPQEARAERAPGSMTGPVTLKQAAGTVGATPAAACVLSTDPGEPCVRVQPLGPR